VKLGGPLKQKFLCIAVSLGPFKSKVFTHYNCCWGRLWMQSSLLILYIAVAVGPLWKQDTLHITVAKGGPRQVPRLPSLKHTTVHNPDNDLIWEYETDWTRSAYPICLLFHLMSACKHCNVKASVCYRTHWSCWWVHHFKKHRFHEIFIIKPRHTGRLIKQIWIEKPLVGAPVTCGKTPTTVTWREHLKIYRRVYCYAIKTTSTTIR